MDFYPLVDQPIQEMSGKKKGSLTLTVNTVVEPCPSLSCFLPYYWMEIRLKADPLKEEPTFWTVFGGDKM